VKRCRPTILAALAAALTLALAGRPTPATADSMSSTTSLTMVDYTLTADNGLPAADPNATAPQVVATIIPPGGIVPPPATTDNPNGNPLTILPDSAGFNQQGLIDLLSKDNKQFGFSFFDSGLLPASQGGKLHFALSIDQALASSPPTFQTPDGIHIVPDNMPVVTPPTSGSGSGSTTPPTDSGSSQTSDPSQVPEPMSLVLWTTLAGAGFWRVRRQRRTATASV
jgi:hypothetical protein